MSVLWFANFLFEVCNFYPVLISYIFVKHDLSLFYTRASMKDDHQETDQSSSDFSWQTPVVHGRGNGRPRLADLGYCCPLTLMAMAGQIV